MQCVQKQLAEGQKNILDCRKQIRENRLCGSTTCYNLQLN